MSILFRVYYSLGVRKKITVPKMNNRPKNRRPKNQRGDPWKIKWGTPGQIGFLRVPPLVFWTPIFRTVIFFSDA